MNKKPLESLFRAMYHDKYDFEDFVRGDVSGNYEKALFRERDRDREVLKPNKKLKAYHIFLNLFLFEHLPINKRVVFSYRKGVSTYNAVAPHATNKCFFQADINAFFSSINRDMVRSTIVAGQDASPISDMDAYRERILDLVSLQDSLPTGLPASPIITNAVLKPFDDLLEQHCRGIAAIYTRYSDDIIVSSQTRDSLEGIKERISAILFSTSNGRLLLNDRKCKYLHVGGKVKLLGMVILPSGQVSVDAKVRNEVEVLLHFFLRDREKFLDKVKGNHDAGIGRVSGFLNYVNTVDKNYLDKLRRKYGATVIDMFLHRSFE